MIRQIEDCWNISDEDFPITDSDSEKLKFLIRYAMLAPSNHNTQPWLFKIKDSIVTLYADRSRALPVADPENRELIISCGAALQNLRIAARYFGYLDHIQTFPQQAVPDLLARMVLTSNTTPYVTENDKQLFHMIPKRRTCRESFKELESFPEAMLAELNAAAASERTSLFIIDDIERRGCIFELIAEATEYLINDAALRAELATWTRPNNGEYSDGIPGYALGIGDLASHLLPLTTKFYNWGKQRALQNYARAEKMQRLFILATDADDAEHWLASGQAIAKVLLRATAADLHGCFFNEVIEAPIFKAELMSILGTNKFPQLLLGLGFSDEVRSTPRRPAAEICIDNIGSIG